jgi:putative two-component system response regulator
MKGKPKILVVDDEHQNQNLMKDFLTSLNYEVILASDGAQALEKVDEVIPDVILLDIIMPEMDGFEVLRRLKEKEESKIIPVVMLTGLNDVEDRVKALDLGADDFFIKPVELIELKARMQSLLKVKAYNDYMIEGQRKLEAEVARRTEQLKHASERIRSTTLEAIYRLSLAAECRDKGTGAHVRRIGHYAVAVAREMNLEKNFVEALVYGLPMHDIGKIGVPDHILLKPGKLTQNEWKIMKQHTTIGGRILKGSDSEFIETAEVIALTHHEKWDGNGYPQGLKGSDIPFVGRVAAVADVFDAMTTSRPYRKKPFSLEETFRVIKEGRGNHFDPEVIDAFFAVKDEILAIKEENRDQDESMIIQVD